MIKEMLTEFLSRRSMSVVDERYFHLEGRPVKLWVDNDGVYWLAEKRWGFRMKSYSRND